MGISCKVLLRVFDNNPKEREKLKTVVIYNFVELVLIVVAAVAAPLDCW